MQVVLAWAWALRTRCKVVAEIVAAGKGTLLEGFEGKPVGPAVAAVEQTQGMRVLVVWVVFV